MDDEHDENESKKKQKRKTRKKKKEILQQLYINNIVILQYLSNIVQQLYNQNQQCFSLSTSVDVNYSNTYHNYEIL